MDHVEAVVDPKWQEIKLYGPDYIGTAEHTGHSVTLVGRKIWFFGGLRSGRRVQSSLFSLDIVSKKWARVEFPKRLAGPMLGPFSLFAHSASLIDERIYFVGGLLGMSNQLRSDQVLTYDLVLEEFGIVKTFGEEKRGGVANHSAHYLQDTGEILLVAGESNTGGFHKHLLFALNARNMTWRKVFWKGTAPSERGNHGSCLVRKKLYVFGGFGPKWTVLADMHVLDLNYQVPTFSQLNLTLKPCGRFGTFMFHYRGQVYMFGGKTAFTGDMDIRLHDLWRFSPSEDTWYECESFNGRKHPKRKANHKGIVIQNRALIFGGTNASLSKLLRISFQDLPSSRFRSKTVL